MKTRISFPPSIKLLMLIGLLLASACGQTDTKDKYLLYPTPEQAVEEMNYTPDKTKFQLWAPTADEVRVLIYKNGDSGHTEKMYNLTLDESTGVWSAEVERDLMGLYYTFNIKVNDLWQGDTPGITAKAVGINGKRAAIIDWSKTNPEGWNQDRPHAPKDVSANIIYELHLRDFTINKSSGISTLNKGKYRGLYEVDTYYDNPTIQTGINHLKELGVTHVKLMPVFDFNGKDELIADASSYTWGYDPLNFNVPEGLYSNNPKNPYSRIIEFKELVMNLHKAGIKVILDVSYAYSNPQNSNFQKTFPGYYFAQDQEDNFIISQNGKAKLATQRPMVREFIIESMMHWISEYHIDGFALDQFDLYDPETLKDIESALRKSNRGVTLMGSPQQKTLRMPLASKGDIPESMKSFATALRSNPNDSIMNSYLLGDVSQVEEVKAGLTGGVKHPQLYLDSLDNAWTRFTTTPLQAINFISSSDGLILGDYLEMNSTSSLYNIEKVRLSKLAYTYLLTAQGTPQLYAGEEFLRSKGGTYNSAKLSDSINQINWDLKAKHLEFFQYIKGLIQLRKNHPAFRMLTANNINKHVEFLPTEYAINK
ncbi:alpha-amylase family glycosyl hydrolase [Bacteroides propionicifaciens]|uniref:alpha-amylase family glycosyl hydrolase n=1 Tax=Bacteroides propionicifaciens TaxID=392838 RepID=UPI000370920C|nr:alpha-amylase family glycosyl hydrolase [Bacteroides propionicifaciens]